MLYTGKTFLCAIIAANLLSTLTHAYVGLSPQPYCPTPCADEQGRYRQINETWYDDDKCEEHTCWLNQGIPYVQIYGCGVVGVTPGCRLVRGNGSYPDCCEDEVC